MQTVAGADPRYYQTRISLYSKTHHFLNWCTHFRWCKCLFGSFESLLECCHVFSKWWNWDWDYTGTDVFIDTYEDLLSLDHWYSLGLLIFTKFEIDKRRIQHCDADGSNLLGFQYFSPHEVRTSDRASNARPNRNRRRLPILAWEKLSLRHAPPRVYWSRRSLADSSWVWIGIGCSVWLRPPYRSAIGYLHPPANESRYTSVVRSFLSCTNGNTQTHLARYGIYQLEERFISLTDNSPFFLDKSCFCDVVLQKLDR